MGLESVSNTGDSLTSLLALADAGDARARDALFATLYDELHRLAEAQLRRSGGSITLGATTLLHEAYLHVSKREQLSFPDRNRFFGYAARAMRGLILNYVRDRRAQKRGGELTFTSIDDTDVAAATPSEDLEQLNHALEELAALEPSLAELVDLRFFCGFSFTEIATIRGISERTAQRDWAKARALLYTFLSGEGEVSVE
jgi:RNA polymerase sigma factor (TIGR02999 family)